MDDHYKTKKNSYSIVQDYSETEGHELCKAKLKFKFSSKEKIMETLFKLKTNFKGSQILIVHTSTLKTFWSLTEVWSVQILILLNDKSLEKLTQLKNYKVLV